MELFCAGDVNRPTRLLALALAAACNRYPQARSSSTVLINGFYPEYRPLILVKTHNIILLYACSAPTIFK